MIESICNPREKHKISARTKAASKVLACMCALSPADCRIVLEIKNREHLQKYGICTNRLTLKLKFAE